MSVETIQPLHLQIIFNYLLVGSPQAPYPTLAETWKLVQLVNWYNF